VNQLRKKTEPKARPPANETDIYEIFRLSLRLFYAHPGYVKASAAPFMI
jgi:hypothetical protein